MQANFVKVNPSGNTTVLILDPLPREIHSRIARQVMRTTSLAAEQVGFVERAKGPGAIARLQMMGGEFCGNASCGFAAWLTLRQFPGIYLYDESGKIAVPLEISGHNGVLTALVRPGTPGEQKYRVEISMPLPRWIKQRLTKSGGQRYTLVGFEGIVHAVTWDLPPSEEQFHRIREEVQQELMDVDCLGVMFYKEDSCELTPVVYVPKVDSSVWESSCGSGAVAVAAALADRDGAGVESLRLSQPGGVIEARVRRGAEFLEARISQEVRIEAEGVVFIHL
jgi:diaminopimelate epimerase